MSLPEPTVLDIACPPALDATCLLALDTNCPPALDVACPPSLDDLRRQLHERLDTVIDICLPKLPNISFLAFERTCFPFLASLGQLLVQLFLLARHQQLDLQPWLKDGRFRSADAYAERILKTTCGPVRYGRAYLAPKKAGKGNGVHPLDAELGLTRDAFTPLVIGYFCRLGTRLSFRLASELGGMFLGWAPAPSAIQEWSQGLGRPAHVWLSTGPLPEGDGEVLVIECDGKAVPTATAEELAKRRGSRKGKVKGCESPKCQRHRSRCRRKARGPKTRRKRGDKSKNGRSATLVVMYTLKKGEDGRLHGPINKKVYGSFSSRKKALEWCRRRRRVRVRAQETDKAVQIIVDGEICLAERLRKLFPKAILTLDIRHAQERLWRVGRLLHAEGSVELAVWGRAQEELLYQGRWQSCWKSWGG